MVCILYPFHVEMEGSVDMGVMRDVLNIFMGYRHLWYVAALIASVLALKLLQSISLSKIIIASLVLHLIGYALTRLYLFNISIPTSTLTTNAIFLGIYFVAIGMAIKRHNLTDKIKNKQTFLFFIVLGLALIIIEATILYFFDSKKNSNFYFSLFFFAPLAIMYLTKYGRTGTSTGFIAKLSAGVYFMHFIVIDIFTKIFQGTDLFLVTILASLMAGTVIYYLNKEIKIFL